MLHKPLTITYTWNTAGFAKDNYTTSATADTLPQETEDSTNIWLQIEGPTTIARTHTNSATHHSI